ncbi:MAG: alpha/beta hydrolase-fold protein [Acidobacteriota bacterium]
MLRPVFASTLLALSLTLTVGWLSAAPATAEAPAAALTVGHIDTLRSEILDEERTLTVRLPDGYATGDARFPVLYLLDPQSHFHYLTGILQELERQGHMPSLIVVGIANTERTRDLTPPWTDESTIEAQGGRAQIIPDGGGGDAFLRFLSDELIPHVDKTYRTEPYRLLVGHSFGGLFALHALATTPDLFRSILAISPSLWWDTGRPVDRLESLFEQRPTLQTQLFATVGNESGLMIDPFNRLQALLRYRAPSGLHWHAKVYDAEDHGTMPIPSTYAALRFFFDGWQIPYDLVGWDVEAVDAHFAGLSSRFGYPVSAGEAVINGFGYRALFSEEVDKAIEIFQVNVDRYPGSANVYDSLGEAVEANGELERAFELYRRAYTMAKDAGADAADPSLVAYQRHMEAVSEKIADVKAE